MKEEQNGYYVIINILDTMRSTLTLEAEPAVVDMILISDVTHTVLNSSSSFWTKI